MSLCCNILYLQKFYLGATVRRWAAVDFGSLSERSLVGFCNKIVAACTEAGMVSSLLWSTKKTWGKKMYFKNKEIWKVG